MAWKHSLLHRAKRSVKASENSLGITGSFHRISHSPAYRIYSLSFFVGKFTLQLASVIASAAQNLWRLTLSDAFDKIIDFFRGVTELKKSRIIRGDVSITRGIFAAARKTSSVAELIFSVFSTRGTISGFMVIPELFRDSVVHFWSKNRRVFNYLAPVAGMAALALTLYFWSNVTLGVTVSYNGKALGAVSNEKVYKAAASDVETKVTDASGASYTLSKAPVYKLELVNKSDLLTEDELYDGILQASSKDVTNGYGLYVDNRLVGSNSDNAAIQTMLDNITASYKNDPNNEKVAFYQDVAIKPGVFPKSVERSADNMKAILTASVKQSQTYVAQKGDSTAMVANMYHISVDQLYAMNASMKTSDLTQGETIQVVSSLPTLQVKYTRRENSTQSIPYSVVSTEASNIAKGKTTITQYGQNGIMQVTSDVTYVGNTVVDSKAITTTTLKAPVSQQQKVGTFDYTAQASNLVGWSGNFAGMSYSSGGAGPYSFDCSGFTMFVYQKFGISLPHNAAAQAGYGTYVSRGSLQPGDLVFFNTNGYGIGHVGIYVGGNTMINAENYGSGVTYTSLSGYWSSTYVTARRVWN